MQQHGYKQKDPFSLLCGAHINLSISVYCFYLILKLVHMHWCKCCPKHCGNQPVLSLSVIIITLGMRKNICALEVKGQKQTNLLSHVKGKEWHHSGLLQFFNFFFPLWQNLMRQISNFLGVPKKAAVIKSVFQHPAHGTGDVKENRCHHALAQKVGSEKVPCVFERGAGAVCKQNSLSSF